MKNINNVANVSLYCVIFDECCEGVEDCEVKQGTLKDLLDYIEFDGKPFGSAFSDSSNQGENDHWNYIWDYNEKEHFDEERVKKDILAGKSIQMGHYTGFMVFNKSLDKAKAKVLKAMSSTE